jgi:HlyD family secretion protein
MLAAVTAVFAATLLAGCSKEKESEAEPVLAVQLAPVAQEPIDRVIAAEGVLRAFDQSAVTPKISAPVLRFYVNRGDHVRQGQLLATLENRDLRAAAADAKGAFEQAAANYRNVSSATVPDEMSKAEADARAAREALDAARKLLESREQLFKEGALARRQVDEAAVAHAQAKGQYDTAQKHLESLRGISRHEEVKGASAQMESAKGRYDAARANLAYAEVRSPISGVVADRPLFAGEMASAGAPLVTVMDASRVIARVNVPQAQASWVKVGQLARIAASDGSTEAKGRVTVVSPAVDPQSTTVEVWVQAANPGERLRPGGTVKVTINAGRVSDALTVPISALLASEEGGTAVMTVGSDMVAHEHKVEVGVRNAEKAQLLSGVKAGDPVVVEGGVGLTDGAKVRTPKPGEEKGGEEKGGDKKDEDDKK